MQPECYKGRQTCWRNKHTVQNELCTCHQTQRLGAAIDGVFRVHGTLLMQVKLVLEVNHIRPTVVDRWAGKPTGNREEGR